MTCKFRSIILTAAIAAPVFVTAAATAEDTPLPAGALATEQITQSIQGAGYAEVSDVEFDDGRYEADATSPAGTRVDLEIDPMSGRIIREVAD